MTSVCYHPQTGKRGWIREHTETTAVNRAPNTGRVLCDPYILPPFMQVFTRGGRYNSCVAVHDDTLVTSYIDTHTDTLAHAHVTHTDTLAQAHTPYGTLTQTHTTHTQHKVMGKRTLTAVHNRHPAVAIFRGIRSLPNNMSPVTLKAQILLKFQTSQRTEYTHTHKCARVWLAGRVWV